LNLHVRVYITKRNSRNIFPKTHGESTPFKCRVNGVLYMMNALTSTVFVIAIVYSLCVGTLEIVTSATLHIPSDCSTQVEINEETSKPKVFTIGKWLIVDGVVCISYALTKLMKRYPELTCSCPEWGHNARADEDDEVVHQVEDQEEEERGGREGENVEEKEEEATNSNFTMSSINETTPPARSSGGSERRDAPSISSAVAVLTILAHRGDVPYARSSPHLNWKVSSKSRAGGFQQQPPSFIGKLFPWIDLVADVSLLFRFAWAVAGTSMFWKCVQAKRIGTIFLMGITQTFIICAIRLCQSCSRFR